MELGAGHLGLTRLLSRGSAPASVKPLQDQSGLRSCLTAHQEGGDIASAALLYTVDNCCELNSSLACITPDSSFDGLQLGGDGRASGRDICGTSGVGARAEGHQTTVIGKQMDVSDGVREKNLCFTLMPGLDKRGDDPQYFIPPLKLFSK